MSSDIGDVVQYGSMNGVTDLQHLHKMSGITVSYIIFTGRESLHYSYAVLYRDSAFAKAQNGSDFVMQNILLRMTVPNNSK